jgi:hypothetical protein
MWFTQSRVHSQLFMRFAGDKDLILMQKGTDDFKILITTPGGIALKINFMHVLEVKLGWEMTKQDLTSTMGRYCILFSTIDGRHAVTLTQELQIEKVADAVYGPDRAAIPAVHTPPSDLSAEASARCEEKVSQKQFMRLMAAWRPYAFRIGSSSTVGVEGHAPTELDWQALCIILPISTGSASWG